MQKEPAASSSDITDVLMDSISVHPVFPDEPDLPHCGDPDCGCPTNAQMAELFRQLRFRSIHQVAVTRPVDDRLRPRPWR